MTEKEKAQAYDEAIEKLRSLHDDYDTVSTLIDIKEELEHIFPELKESEDERIRKALIHLISEQDGFLTAINGVNVKDIIAWLEKKREQKQVIIAKFQIGDKVRLKGSCGWYNVAEIRGNAYYLTSHDVVPCLLPICEQDNWEVEQKPTDNDMKEALRTEYEKGRADAMAEVQNSAWSEDDDDNMLMIEDRLSDYLDYIREDSSLTKHRKNSLKEEVIGYVKWLKSLKGRVQPQNTWKPSKEQMLALKEAEGIVGCLAIIGEQIKSLYQDLKKLREE